MRRIHQTLQALRASIAGLRSVRRDSVVSPVAHARKSRHRHKLDHGHSKLFQVRKLVDHSIESAFGSECSDVQFVQDVIFERQATPIGIAPPEALWIDDLSRSMDAFRQQTRNWIGYRLFVINDVEVSVARAGRCVQNKMAALEAFHGVLTRGLPFQQL